MGAFGGLILTNKGRNLQAKAQTGVQLNFTKVKIGDGSLSGQSILDLTNLISTKKELTILGLETLTGGKAKLSSYFSNADLATGFYWRELGIFAQDPQEGEILYCYGNAGANAEYIPAGGGPDVVERFVRVITLIGNASNISATLGSEIFVTQAEFNAHASRHALAGADPLAPADIGAETPAGAQAKADAVQANLNTHTGAAAPHTGHALASDLTAHLADYAAHNAVRAGTGNKDTQEVKTLLVETDTRSVEVTRTSGQITGMAVKDPADGATVASASVTRTSGQVSSIAVTVGARTVTATINRISGQVTSITKAVS